MDNPFELLLSRFNKMEALLLTIIEKSEKEEDKLLTTQEVAKLFSVTNVTISSWISKGLLTPCSMGGRNYFKYSEVLESMKTLKKYKTK